MGEDGLPGPVEDDALAHGTSLDALDADEHEHEASLPASPAAQDAVTAGGGVWAYLRRLRKMRPLAGEDEVALVLSAQAGDSDALNRLVSHALPIVPPVARQFIGRGVALEDLIEEGNLGLYRAVPKFDVGMGYRFSTYARWWVRHEIRSAIMNQGRLVRLPSHVYRAVAKAREQWRTHHAPGRAPDAGRDDGQDRSRSYRLPEDDVYRLLRLSELPVSLDHPLGRDSDGPVSLVDTLVDDREATPEDTTHATQRLHLILSLMEQLAEMEREIIRRRYGFGGEVETLEAIGQSLQLSAERIRQIQKQAVQSLRGMLLARGIAGDTLL